MSDWLLAGWSEPEDEAQPRSVRACGRCPASDCIPALSLDPALCTCHRAVQRFHIAFQLRPQDKPLPVSAAAFKKLVHDESANEQRAHGESKRRGNRDWKRLRQ